MRREDARVDVSRYRVGRIEKDPTLLILGLLGVTGWCVVAWIVWTFEGVLR